MRIQHLKAGHLLPAYTGFLRYDPSWVWVVMDGENMVAALIAAPAHDTVLLLELLRFGEVSGDWIGSLLKQVARECRERGFDRVMTWLSDARPEERKLRKVMETYGGRAETFSGVVMAGEIHHV